MESKLGSDVNFEIEDVVRDYFEGWNDADPERIARALHPHWPSERRSTTAAFGRRRETACST